jgi:hypothetical protein
LLDFEQFANETLQSLLEDLVIVIPPSITGDPGAAGLIELRGARLRTVIKHSQTDDGASRRKQVRWTVAPICPVICQIAHLTGLAVVYPGLISSRVRVRRCGCDPR